MTHSLSWLYLIRNVKKLRLEILGRHHIEGKYHYLYSFKTLMFVFVFCMSLEDVPKNRPERKHFEAV